MKMFLFSESFLDGRVRALPILFSLFLSLQGVQGQDRAQLLKAAREVMEGARYCALITVDSEGSPQARAMDPFPPSEDFKVWLGTNAETSKVDEIGENPRVALYYFWSEAAAYVMLKGTARLVDDAEARASYWKKEWAPFYEDENRGEDYILIEVTPLLLEMVSYKHGVAADPKQWGPATVHFSPHEPSDER